VFVTCNSFTSSNGCDVLHRIGVDALGDKGLGEWSGVVDFNEQTLVACARVAFVSCDAGPKECRFRSTDVSCDL